MPHAHPPYPAGWPAALFLFADRIDAGRQLSSALRAEPLADAIVVGIARGGVVVAAEIARSRSLPLDAVAVAKIQNPVQPRRTLGAVAPGHVLYPPDIARLRGHRVAASIGAAVAEVDRLDTMFHRHHLSLDLSARTCLLVDDGAASGASLIAAARWAHRNGALRVVAAVPLAPRSIETRLRAEVDELVCPNLLDELISIGLWYKNFAPVELDEVTTLLALGSLLQPAGPAGPSRRPLRDPRPSSRRARPGRRDP